MCLTWMRYTQITLPAFYFESHAEQVTTPLDCKLPVQHHQLAETSKIPLPR
jgi:hypothetical protein